MRDGSVRSGADRFQEFVDAIGEQIGGLHRHIVPGADFGVAGAGNGLWPRFPPAAAGARDRGCRRSRGPDKSAGRVRPACRLPPAFARSWHSSRDRCRAIASGSARTGRCRREAPGHSRSTSKSSTANAMPAASIRARRSSAAARRSAAMPVAGLPTATALVRSLYRAAKCRAIAPPTAIARKRDLAGDPKMIEQGCDVVGHRIEGKLAAHLLRQSSAPGVIAQHPARFREPWRDVVPAFERAAHFVNQHQRAVAAAAQLAAQPDAVGFNEIHPAPPEFF